MNPSTTTHRSEACGKTAMPRWNMRSNSEGPFLARASPATQKLRAKRAVVEKKKSNSFGKPPPSSHRSRKPEQCEGAVAICCRVGTELDSSGNTHRFCGRAQNSGIVQKPPTSGFNHSLKNSYLAQQPFRKTRRPVSFDNPKTTNSSLRFHRHCRSEGNSALDLRSAVPRLESMPLSRSSRLNPG